MRWCVLFAVAFLSLNTFTSGQQLLNSNDQLDEATKAAQTGNYSPGSPALLQDDSQTRYKAALAEVDRGSKFLSSKEYNAAALAFENATSIEPSLFVAAYDLGITYLAQNNYEGAIRTLKQAVALSGDSANGWVHLGAAYDKVNDRKSAMDSYLRALSINPQMVLANSNLGFHYLALKQYDHAESAFRAALNAKSDFRPASEGMCFTSSLLGNIDDATKYCRIARARDEGNWLYDYFLGSAYVSAGQVEEGLALLNESLRLEQQRPEIYVARGQAFRKLGRFSDAFNNCDRAIALDPGLASAYEAMAATLYDKGEYRQAKQTLYKALSISPESEEAHYNLGITCLSLGQRECAFEQYSILKNMSTPRSNQLFNQIYGNKIVNVTVLNPGRAAPN